MKINLIFSESLFVAEKHQQKFDVFLVILKTEFFIIEKSKTHL